MRGSSFGATQSAPLYNGFDSKWEIARHPQVISAVREAVDSIRLAHTVVAPSYELKTSTVIVIVLCAYQSFLGEITWSSVAPLHQLGLKEPAGRLVNSLTPNEVQLRGMMLDMSHIVDKQLAYAYVDPIESTALKRPSSVKASSIAIHFLRPYSRCS